MHITHLTSPRTLLLTLLLTLLAACSNKEPSTFNPESPTQTSFGTTNPNAQTPSKPTPKPTTDTPSNTDRRPRNAALHPEAPNSQEQLIQRLQDPTWRRTLPKLYDLDAFRKRYLTGVQASLKTHDLARDLLQTIAKDDPTLLFPITPQQTIQHISTRTNPDTQTPEHIFRLTTPNSLDYFSVLTSKRDNKVTIADTFVFSVGQWQSDSIAAVTLPFLQREDPEAKPTSPSRTPLSLEDSKTLNSLLAQGAKRSYQENLTALAALPPHLQKHKPTLVNKLFLHIENRDFGSNYTQTLNTLQTNFPPQPYDTSTLFFSVDYHIHNRNLQPALQAIDNLDKRVGKDPYLDLKRAQALFLTQDYEKTQSTLDTFLKAFPKDPQGLELKKALLSTIGPQ